MEDRNILLIFILYVVSVFMRLFAQCFIDLLFFVKGIIRSDFYGLHVYMVFERKKTPVFSTRRFSIAKNIFHSCHMNI